MESFVLLDNPNKSEKEKPPSILIQTPSRGLKVECVDMPSHHAWLKVRHLNNAYFYVY